MISTDAPICARPRWSAASTAATTIAALILTLMAGARSHAQLRVVNYNVAQLNGDLDALQNVIAELHADDRDGFANPVALFIFQEVEAADRPTLVALINSAADNGITYFPATYTNFGEDNFGGAQLAVYRSGLLTELTAGHADIFTQAGRYTDRWQFKLTGPYANANISFYVYSSHLKADTGAADAADRLTAATAIRANAANLPADAHVIYAGDYNLYSNNESAYLKFLQAGVNAAFDPLGTGSWGGMSNALKHSQSPRLLNFGGLTGGGMDDRFDFQLSDADFVDGEGLALISGSYRSVGNDGQHYNLAVNEGNNFYFPGEIARSNFLADSLYLASDHIPLLAEYQIPAVLNTSLTPIGTVIEGANISAAFTLANVAPVVTPGGADEGEVTATASGALLQNANVVALSGTPGIAMIPINTSVPGPVSGQLTFSTSSEDAVLDAPSRMTSGMVLRHANASLDDADDVNDNVVEVMVMADDSPVAVPVMIHNLGYDAGQARLDVDGVSGAIGPFSVSGALPTNIADTPGTVTFMLDPSGVTPNTYIANVTVQVSDENLPGEASSELTLTLRAIVSDSGQPCPADLASDGAGVDGLVNVFDLLELLGNWGAAGTGADLAKPDDVVNVFDLLELLGDWGACP